MNYALKKALIAHKETIYQIKKSSVFSYVDNIWGWDEEYQKKDFDSDFSNLEQFQIIEISGKISGFVQTYEHDDTVELVEIHLIPEMQGKGIGSHIINSILEKAKSESKIVRLGCFKENHGAKKLYLKLGFIQTEQTDTHCIFVYK